MTNFFLYILSSRHHRHLSVGVTADLELGVNNHRTLVNRKLNRKRVLQKLVYVESIQSLDDAVARELQLKRYSRMQMCQLIESVNPGWDSISLRKLVAAGFDRNATAFE